MSRRRNHPGLSARSFCWSCSWLLRGGQKRPPGHDGPGRKDRPDLEGHGQREIQLAESRPFPPRHGPDREPGVRKGQGRQGDLLLQIDRAQLAAQAAGREAAWPQGGLTSRRHGLPPSRPGATSSGRRQLRRKDPLRGEYQRPCPPSETAEANLSATEQRMRSWANLPRAATRSPRRP